MTQLHSVSSLANRGAPFALDRSSAERLTGGRWLGAAAAATIHGATMDSRRVHPGCLFACLPGAKSDGHDFAATAVGDGAALILATRPVAVPVPVLVVADVTAALGALAAEFRRRYAKDCVWIGVAGANGKTTTKELIAAALAEHHQRARVHATKGNYNNQLGLPLTILNTPAGCRAAVIEIGANHPGEVAALAAIAQPTVGVIASIGPEHLEGFGSLEGVARAESELFAALPAGAPAIFGATGLAEHAAAHGTTPERLLEIVQSAASGRQLRIIDQAAIRGRTTADGLIIAHSGGETPLYLLGVHNLANATAALAVAQACGVPEQIAVAGVARVRPVAGRLVSRPCGRHTLLDDTYNANPASMFAALDVLAAATGGKLAILGAMGELGAASEASHRQVGERAARLGLPLFAVAAPAIAAGYRAAGGVACQEVADPAAAVTALTAPGMLCHPTTILAKASRSAALERVVAGLLHELGGQPC